MESWTHEKIDIKGWQFIPEKMDELGLTMEDGLTQAWFVDEEGILTGGAEAINASFRYIWWARPIAPLYYMPGVRQIQDRVYRWVADNRYKMPGSTDACAIPANKTEISES